MSKINIIYWSGTGNTEAMANHIYNACNKENSKILSVDKATVKDAEEADVLFLGCAAMGDEVLEESEMEPFMESIEGSIKGKKITLFGSYGWGDGQWMRDWEERITKCGGVLVEDSIISNGEPTDEEIEKLSKQIIKNIKFDNKVNEEINYLQQEIEELIKKSLNLNSLN